MTKPVDAKYGGKKPIVLAGEKIKLNVEMAGVSTRALQPVETTDNSTAARGTHDKYTHTIRCKICLLALSRNLMIITGEIMEWLL